MLTVPILKVKIMHFWSNENLATHIFEFSILEIRKLSKVPTLNMEHICVKEEKRYTAFGTGYTTCSILSTDTFL